MSGGTVSRRAPTPARQKGRASPRPRATPAAPGLELWTIGHSTRGLEEFIGLLRPHQIAVVADVRRFPGSRRHPQFNQAEFAGSLVQAGMSYEHFPELGGRRVARPDSPNVAWRNAAFRGYADYMMTGAFEAGVERLLKLARAHRTAIMCAEAVWWQCHRSLIADYLKAKGIKVWHIMSATKTEEHPFTSAAQLVAGQLSYAGHQAQLEPELKLGDSSPPV